MLREEPGLGRRVPTDWGHVERHRLTMPALAALMPPVEKVLKIPHYVYEGQHDQGSEGACVGFGTSLMLSILNTQQAKVLHRYDPWWLWNSSKVVDEWPDTNPGDSEGTSVRAACNILRDVGHVRVKRRKADQPKLTEGIKENKWATTVDEMRACIALGIPISIGVNWYSLFDHPQRKWVGPVRSEWWLVGPASLGSLRGGHCTCIYGASDKRQAFRMANSWGKKYPLVWVPYDTMQRLLDEYGEATLVSDL